MRCWAEGCGPAVLHEVFATGWSAGGFAVLLALQAARPKTAVLGPA